MTNLVVALSVALGIALGALTYTNMFAGLLASVFVGCSFLAAIVYLYAHGVRKFDSDGIELTTFVTITAYGFLLTMHMNPLAALAGFMVGGIIGIVVFRKEF